MISKRKIADSIDSIRNELQACWNVLSEARNYTGKNRTEIGSRLIELQSDLIRILSKLDTLYRSVVREKKRLISKKKIYDYKWFSRKMNSLDECRKVIVETIGITKTIGDGYAWIFYQNSDDLLEEHAKLQRQTLLPPGVGGIGERAFVEKAQGFGGHFVLYHGITTFLRLGDVSFIDLTQVKVKSIGELKTQRSGTDTYNITLGYVSGSKIEPFNLSVKATELESQVSKGKSTVSPLSEQIRQSLNKQMMHLAKTLADVNDKGTQFRHNIVGDYYFEELQDLLKRSSPHKFVAEQVGSGLLIVALRLSEKDRNPLRRPGNKLVGAYRKLNGIERHAMKIGDPNLKDNCIFVGNLVFDDIGFPSYWPGALPVLWWPVENDMVRDIIFGNVLVITLYNPAHFWQMLRGRGFKVEIGEKSKFICARRVSGEAVVELRDFERFSYLAQSHLMSEDTIISMIDRVIDQIEESGTKLNTKIQIKPVVKVNS